MKKFLLCGVALIAAINSNAQLLESQDFNAFTVGNASGQGGYTFFNGTTADYQITAAPTTGNYLAISASGGTTATAQIRYYYPASSTVEASWGTKAATNDILYGEVDIFTGTETSTTAGRACSNVYNAAGSGVVGISWNHATKTFNGLLALKAVATGVVGGYNLSFAGAATFAANTWYKVKYQYNSTTGVGKWTFPNGVTYTWDNTSNNTVQVVPGLIPAEHDFLNISNLAGVRTYGFDNYKLEATNATTLASNEVVIKGDISNISIYPNPTTDVLNVSNTKKLESFKVYDLSGKIVLEGTPSGTSVNVSKLAKGSYVIRIVTLENGVETRKFIKK